MAYEVALPPDDQEVESPQWSEERLDKAKAWVSRNYPEVSYEVRHTLFVFQDSAVADAFREKWCIVNNRRAYTVS